MNWKIISAFFAGGVVGGLGTWYGVKRHYETRANEEIARMKAYYHDKLEKAKNENTTIVEFSPNMSETDLQSDY